VRQGLAATPVEVGSDGRVRVGDPGDVFLVTAVSPGEYLVSSGAHTWRVAVAGPPEARWVAAEGAGACLEVQPEGETRAPRQRAAHGALAAPMPGTVIDVSVAVGQQVRAGDLLLTLEAMKMEMPVRAPRGGTVASVNCAIGELVQPGVLLVDIG
jgi:biotin carboxyl carrier protein